MRRDYFTLHLGNVDSDGAAEKPAARIAFDGPSDVLQTRLMEETDAVDVAYRLQTPLDVEDADGVFSITDRVTGEFLLEVNADATTVFELIDAARAYGQQSNDTDGCYEVAITRDDETLFATDKRMLLVYDQDGDLRRQHSLIPSGVEL
jgi:hypothetical protein